MTVYDKFKTFITIIRHFDINSSINAYLLIFSHYLVKIFKYSKEIHAKKDLRKIGGVVSLIMLIEIKVGTTTSELSFPVK